MPLLPTTVTVSLSAGESNTFGAVTVAGETFVHQTLSTSNPLTNGTGAGQATHPVEVTGNATTGGVAIDLTAIGAGTGLDGKNRDFSNGGTGRIKAFLLENLDATNTITVSQGSNGWTGISGAATGLSEVIEPGGFILVYAPVTGKAVSSTNKSLTLTADANTPQYKMSIVGIAA